MTAIAPAIENLTLNVTRGNPRALVARGDLRGAARRDGAGNEGPDGAPMPMMLEPWPGGRWFRDLGDNNGHFWGHVQAIKRPTLLEITGPLLMSFAVASNVQYRLKEVDGGTLITLRHTALGLFPDGFREALVAGLAAHLRARPATREQA